MKLRSLGLNQFKKFTSPVRLDGIGDGLNVVVGPNEMGKSTLLNALRAALFEKYSSKAQPIIALQNDRNQAAPVVELTFELDHGQYTIAKRFVKKPYARLSCPDGRTLEGDAAEEELRNLLAFEEAGKTGAKPESIGMWNVLWVQQGQSFGTFEIPESARSSLHGALESEVGAVLGGRRGRALPQVIEKQRGELVTSAGKPRAKYKGLIEETESLSEEISGLQIRRQELSEKLDQLEEHQETLSRLSSSTRDQADAEELDAARLRHHQLSELESRIEAVATDLKLKARDLEQAEQATEQRGSLKDQITADEEALTKLKEQQDEIRQHEQAAQSRLQELRKAVREAEAVATTADEKASRARRMLSAVRHHDQIQALQSRYEKAKAAEERGREAQQKAGAIRVTDDALKRIKAAATEAEKVTSQLSAAATQITFDIAEDQLSGIAVDGAPLSRAQNRVQAVQPVTIDIPERGRITVAPAIRDREELIDRQRKSKTTLKDELEAVGASSLADAEEQHGRRKSLLQDAELARQEAELHAPATVEYAAGAQALGDYIEGLRQMLRRETEELDLQELPALAQAETALREFEEQAEEARGLMERARAALSGPEEAIGQIQSGLASAAARYDERNRQLERLRGHLKAAEDELPEDKLQVGIESAQEDLAKQESALADLEAQRCGETLDQLDVRIARLEQAIRERREKREKLNVEISGLRSHVEAQEGAGLDELIEQKEREREFCVQERNRVAREVEVLTLLLTALREAEHEAKDRYLSPVLDRVRPYLQLLFPGADITIDEDLHVTGVVRDGAYEEAFQHLSTGTQEQIAILVRLAFAEMLAEQGHPATVVLDDALVFSDDTRMRRMFDILNMVARKVQVIVLTCRAQLFEELGGSQLLLQGVSAEELVSA